MFPRSRKLILSSVGLFLLCLMVFVATAGMAHTAHAAPVTPSKVRSTPMSCYVTVVYLHGTNSPTMDCLVKTKPAADKSVPDTQVEDCALVYTTPWVAFYENADYGGEEICFIGTGFIPNLGEYWIDWPFVSWNDQVSSLNMGAYGYLYQDINGGGKSCYYHEGEENSYINNVCGSGWNDTLSSFSVQGG